MVLVEILRSGGAVGDGYAALAARCRLSQRHLTRTLQQLEQTRTVRIDGRGQKHAPRIITLTLEESLVADVKWKLPEGRGVVLRRPEDPPNVFEEGVTPVRPVVRAVHSQGDLRMTNVTLSGPSQDDKCHPENPSEDRSIEHSEEEKNSEEEKSTLPQSEISSEAQDPARKGGPGGLPRTFEPVSVEVYRSLVESEHGRMLERRVRAIYRWRTWRLTPHVVHRWHRSIYDKLRMKRITAKGHARAVRNWWLNAGPSEIAAAYELLRDEAAQLAAANPDPGPTEAELRAAREFMAGKIHFIDRRAMR